jgi:CTD kinase subunit alpha
MLELFTTKPVFQGNDEIHQLDVIHKILGTPTTDRWPALMHLPWYELAKPRDEIPNRFRDIFQKYVRSRSLL